MSDIIKVTEELKDLAKEYSNECPYLQDKCTLELTLKELGAIYKWMGCAEDCGLDTYMSDDKDIKALVKKIIETYNRLTYTKENK